MTQYYVDITNGLDTNAGTSPGVGNAWQTVIHAMTVMVAGDTCNFAPGVYPRIKCLNSGSPGAYLRFVGAPNFGTKLRWNTGSDGTVALYGSYIEINGFDITTSLNADGSSYIANAGVLTQPSTHHHRIYNNQIWNCGGGGIQTYFSDYPDIRGNVICTTANLVSNGLSCISCFKPIAADYVWQLHGIVSGNVCMNSFAGGGNPTADGNGIILDTFNLANGNVGDVTGYIFPWLVENNICIANGARGIELRQVWNSIIRNNTTVGNMQATDMGSAGLNKVTTFGEFVSYLSLNNRWVNNVGTVVDPRSSGFDVSKEFPPPYTLIVQYGNSIVNRNLVHLVNGVTGSEHAEHTLAANGAGYSYGSGNLSTDPLFSNLPTLPSAGTQATSGTWATPPAISTAAGWVTPGTGSPALASGDPLWAPSVDILGNSRRGRKGVDMGAVQVT